MSSLFETYYRRKLAELNPSVRTAAQQVLEDGLLTEDGATGEGRRMSVDSRALIGQFNKIGLDEALLKALANTFLIRPELNTVGGVSYEISHDTLIAPIQKAKTVRKLEEERLDTFRKQQEAEKKAKEEETKRLEAERQKRQARLLAGAAIIGLVLALGAMFWAISAQLEAKHTLNNFIIADKQRRAAEDANRKNDFEKDLQAANLQLLGNGSCLGDALFDRLQKTVTELKDSDVNTKIQNLNGKIRKNVRCDTITISQNRNY